LLFRGRIRRGQVWQAALIVPLFWVAVEYIIAITSVHGTFGDICYSQMNFLPILQIASVMGAWGISFCIFLFAATVAALLSVGSALAKAPLAIVVSVFLAGVLGFGVWRLATTPKDSPTLRVGLIASDEAANLQAGSPTTDPSSEPGVWSDQIPVGPVVDVRITEPAGEAPTAAQMLPPEVLWFMHDTPTKNWRFSLAGVFAEFQTQLPLVSDPSSSSPEPDGLAVIPVTAQSAVLVGAGDPQDTEVTASTELGNPVAWAHASGDWVRSPVHTAAAPVAVPMATHVVGVHERPVIEEAPVGKVDSGIQVLPPNVAIGTEMMVASVGFR
jgi:hypothetical protein